MGPGEGPRVLQRSLVPSVAWSWRSRSKQSGSAESRPRFDSYKRSAEAESASPREEAIGRATAGIRRTYSIVPDLAGASAQGLPRRHRAARSRPPSSRSEPSHTRQLAQEFEDIALIVGHSQAETSCAPPSSRREKRRQVAWSRDRMILDAADAGDVLGDDTKRRSFLLRSDGPPEMHDAVQDDDIRGGRVRPFTSASAGARYRGLGPISAWRVSKPDCRLRQQHPRARSHPKKTIAYWFGYWWCSTTRPRTFPPLFKSLSAALASSAGRVSSGIGGTLPARTRAKSSRRSSSVPT